jgi:uroporphyrinogen-III decarboxylase
VEHVVVDCRERILTAINHEEPDRVPVMSLILDQATNDQVLGRERADLIAMLKDPASRQPMKKLLNGIRFWNQTYYDIAAGSLESAIQLGFDAAWALYTLLKLKSDRQSSLGLVWHDVFGRIFELVPDGKGGTTASYTRGLCGTQEKWEAWVEGKAPLFERHIRGAARFHEKLFEEYSDRISPMGFAGPEVFANSWQAMGCVEFTRVVYEQPEFIRRVIAFHTDLYLRHLEVVTQSGAEIVLAGDDLAQKTGPMLRPELIEKLFGESYRRIAELVHGKGKKLIFHSCGNVYSLLDKFVEWGFDGLITLEPTAGMDLGKVREQVGHKLVLIGNLDVSHLLVKGSREEVDEAVKQAIRAAAPGGGYILSASHSHAGVDPTRLGWMVEAAHRYGEYPIRV